DGPGVHARGGVAWLTGAHAKRTPGPDVELVMKGGLHPVTSPGLISIDQMAAKEFGKHTKLASLETSLESIGTAGACTDGYACGYQIWFSWNTPTTPLHHEPNPRLVFERLFGDGSSPAEQKLRLKKERSILDSVTAEMNRLNRDLGNRDRGTLDEYLEAIRDGERRI